MGPQLVLGERVAQGARVLGVELTAVIIGSRVERRRVERDDDRRDPPALERGQRADEGRVEGWA